MKVKIFKSTKNKQWYFHFVSRNGRVIAQSEEYQRRGAAKKAVDSITQGSWSSWWNDQRSCVE